MIYKGVIFDFNGTLFKDGEYHILAWQQISKELTGVAMSREEIESTSNGVCNEVTIERLSQGKLSKVENLLFSQKKEAIYRDLVQQDQQNAKLVPGAVEYFTALKERNIPFTIASASIIENIDFFFEFFELGKWFDRNKVIYDDGNYPNKVSMFLSALDTLKTPIHETLIIEDSNSGYACAKEADFHPIAMIYNTPQRKEEIDNKFQVDFLSYDFQPLLTDLVNEK